MGNSTTSSAEAVGPRKRFEVCLFFTYGVHVCVACALARAGDHGFSVTTESERKDLEVLERARRQLDLNRPAQAAKGGGKGKPSGL